MYIYEENGILLSGAFAKGIDIPHGAFWVSEVPAEPIESWYIEDGQIKIDRVKLKQIERERMPRLTLIEFATVLDAHGLLEAVEDYMETQAPLLARIAYQRASFIGRADPTLIDMAEKLNISPDQVDAMWLSL